MKYIIEKNRNFIMGMAILWVAIYHLPNHTGLPLIGFLQDIGYGGVDIFIFLSGYGVANSLAKNEDATSFLLRRMKRILPAYLPFIVIWMVYRFVTYQIYMTEILGNLTMTGWWNNSANQFNWYIDAIVIFYILSPYIYGLLKRAKNTLLVGILLMALSYVISMSFMHGVLIIASSRLPIFVLGILLYFIKDHKLISDSKYIIVWNLIMICGFICMYYFLYLQTAIDKWHYGMWWYPMILIAPGLCIDLGYLGEFLSKNLVTNLINRLINLFGMASFELFLWHIFIFESAEAKHIEGSLVWIALFVGAFVIGLIYYKIIEYIKRSKL